MRNFRPVIILIMALLALFLLTVPRQILTVDILPLRYRGIAWLGDVLFWGGVILLVLFFCSLALHEVQKRRRS